MTSNLVVLTFDGASKAEAALDDFQKLQDKGLLTIEDAVVAYRYPMHSDPPPIQTQVGQGYMAGTEAVDEPAVRIKQTHHPSRKPAAEGGAVGLVAGLLLGGPIGGLVVGAGAGAIAGRLRDHGIDQDVVKQITDHMQPDTSVLFVLGEVHDPETVRAEARSFGAQVLLTDFSQEQEQALRQALEPGP